MGFDFRDYTKGRDLRPRHRKREYLPKDMPADWPLSPQQWNEYKYWLGEQGQWYNQATRGFKQKLGLDVGELLGQDTRRYFQEMGRRGLEESGFSQAGYTALRGKYGREYLRGTADFGSKLALMLEKERGAFLAGEFDFFHQLQKLRYQADLEKEIASFKAGLQEKRSGWLGFLGTALGTVLSLWNPIAGIAVGLGTGAFDSFSTTSPGYTYENFASGIDITNK